MRPHTNAFQSCLLLSSGQDETLPFVRALHSSGIAVLERPDDDPGLKLALSNEFDIVAIACSGGEPDCALLGRLAASGVAVVALFAEATSRCISVSLTAGADACLQLDAEPMVVVAQVKAVLRRHGRYAEDAAGSSGVLQLGDLCVDIDRCEVQRAGTNVPLTATEFRILEYMARNAGRVLRPHEILNAVSDDYEYLPREAQDVFKVYVRRIRRKLEISEAEPAYLITVRGFGYRLEGGAQGAFRHREVAAMA